MGLILITVFGFVVWIVLWAINVKSFDTFMITADHRARSDGAHPGAVPPGQPPVITAA